MKGASKGQVDAKTVALKVEAAPSVCEKSSYTVW